MDYEDTPTTQKIRATIEKHLNRVRQSGAANVVALCPFHDDHSPSFAMNVTNGLYICYSCGASGNFRAFLKNIGYTPHEISTSFGLTLQHIKNNAPPPPDPTKPEVVMDVNRHIPTELLGIFQKGDQERRAAIAACTDDTGLTDFSDEILTEFGIGIDTLHRRITFPIRDLAGNLVGISGRAMAGQEPRYKVYDDEYRKWELPPYNTDKAKCLWNAAAVKPTIRTGQEPVVVVEGFKGAMWLRQAGVPRVVALMTKSMSWEQCWILKKMTSHHILMLDNDKAGIEGTINVSAELAKSSPFLRVVEYDGLQPTDIPLEDVVGVVANATAYDDLFE